MVSFGLVLKNIPKQLLSESRGWSKRLLGGQKKVTNLSAPQSITIAPVNVPHQVSWEEEVNFVVLLLEPD